MSTAQRRGWKQSKLASWQQLNSATQPTVEETPKTETVVVKFDEPLNNVVEVEITKEVENNAVLEETEKVELPKIVKKNKKTD